MMKWILPVASTCSDCYLFLSLWSNLILVPCLFRSCLFSEKQMNSELKVGLCMPSNKAWIAQNFPNRENQLFVVSSNRHIWAGAMQYQNQSRFLLAAAFWEAFKNEHGRPEAWIEGWETPNPPAEAAVTSRRTLPGPGKGGHEKVPGFNTKCQQW